jgi:twitching motility protein PilT
MTTPSALRGQRDSRLGSIALERGLISREELEALAARPADPARGARRMGERLVVERFITAPLLQELLEDQRLRRGLPSVARPRAGLPPAPPFDLVETLAFTRAQGGTELVIEPGRPRALRRHGALVAFDEPDAARDAVERLAAETFSDDARARVARGEVASRILETPSGRFRAMLAGCDRGPVLTTRALSLELDASAERLPAELAALASLRRGLVVIAGGQAAERALVLAEIIDLANRRSRRHIITIERQMSFEHASRLSLVAQREVGRHTASYESALRAALREDPDVIALGEMWEPEAIATAILAAETGHLVFCSLHAADAAQAIRRLVDVQGDERRSLVRATLANTLQAIAVTAVVPGRDGERLLVADIVPGSPSVTRLIREDRLHQLETMSAAASGTTCRDERIVKLFQAGRITRAVALERMAEPARLDGIGGVEPE